MTRHQSVEGQTLITFPKHRAPVTVHDLDSDYCYFIYTIMSSGDSGPTDEVLFDGEGFPHQRDPHKQIRQALEDYDVSDLAYGWHTITPEAWQHYDSDPEYEAPLLPANEYGGVSF